MSWTLLLHFCKKETEDQEEGNEESRLTRDDSHPGLLFVSPNPSPYDDTEPRTELRPVFSPIRVDYLDHRWATPTHHEEKDRGKLWMTHILWFTSYSSFWKIIPFPIHPISPPSTSPSIALTSATGSISFSPENLLYHGIIRIKSESTSSSSTFVPSLSEILVHLSRRGRGEEGVCFV